MNTTDRQLELVPTEELRGQLTIAGALEDWQAEQGRQLEAGVQLAALLASATGKVHATAAGGWQALCGTDTALPLRDLDALTLEAAAVELNDRHLDGRPVCNTCRAKVSVAAMTGAQL